jgi:hypothetical protein
VATRTKAVKALSAAATSLALAAESLSHLYENDDEDAATVKSDNSNLAKDRIDAPTPASMINYDSGDSDDEYMALAREAVRAATAGMSGSGGHTPGTGAPHPQLE